MSLRTAAYRVLLVCFAVACAACLAVRAAQLPTSDQPADPVKLETKSLPNAIQITPKVISGGLPEGDAGFAELEALGVKTVIDVDGIKPDVAGAKRHGMRYVHLPHGYDGIPPNRVEELAKAVRDLPGPIYIHCHHGKHRSPVAATVGCVGAGLIEPDMADDILKLAGTGKNYVGLFRVAKMARPIDPDKLDRLRPDFPEVAKVPAMAEAMVEIDLSLDRIKQGAAAGWTTPQEHPDLEPAHEALIFRERFTELLRAEEVQQRPEDFRKLLADSEAHAEELEEALEAPRSPESLQKAKSALMAAAANCTACHAKYRDNPDLITSR
jgi:protein tyrosine phosphatase (PTP) superfamily phosphohydrolase (DUF442 family)